MTSASYGVEIESHHDMGTELEDYEEHEEIRLVQNAYVYPPRDLEEALRLHTIASENLEYVFRKVSAMERPQMRDLYLNSAKAECAPPHLQLDTLFQNFNKIARAGFKAHPSHDITINSLIMYYGYDEVHSFNRKLNQTRYNLVLAIYMWQLAIARAIEEKYMDSWELWFHFVYAWLESTFQDGHFEERELFINKWYESEYDLVKFPSSLKKYMYRELGRLMKSPPPLANPLRLICLCREGKVSKEELMRDGPSMALHYIIAHEDAVQKDKASAEELLRFKNEGAEEALVQEFESLLEQQREMRMGEGFAGVDAAEKSGSAGQNDGSDLHGIDLSLVPWGSYWMQALLTIDKTITVPGGLQSDRKNWIEPEAAGDVFGKLLHDITDALGKMSL